MIKYVTVPKNGQISIGKKYAGRTFAIEEVEGGIALTVGSFIPDHHKTFFTPESVATLKEFSVYARENPLNESDTDNSKEVLEGLLSDAGDEVG